FLGHRFDQAAYRLEDAVIEPVEWRNQLQIQKAFFRATFSIMGHLAKADGQVTRAEIDWAEKVIDSLELSPELRQAAIKLFNEGKRPDFALDKVLDQLRNDCRRKTSLLRIFIEIQIQAAFADGKLSAVEDRLLKHICRRLRFSNFEYQRIKGFFAAQQVFSEYGQQGSRFDCEQTSNIDHAYTLLGSKPSASDEEIKQAYRHLMSQNHPDKLLSKGLSEESIQLATEKTQKIRKAYELIREYRKKT
ncbi:MAG: co-chaperone DjlA, partial [Methylococcales bacterium]